jgi:hypothetical protein
MDAHIAGPCEILSDITENGAAQDVWVRLGVSMGPVVLVLNGSLAAGGSATAKFYTANEGTETDSALTGTVYDYRASGDSYALDDRGIGVWIDNAWYFSAGAGAVTSPPRWFLGTLGGALASASATVSVTKTAALDGGSGGSGSVTAQNDFGLSGQSGVACLIVEDNSVTEFVLVQVKHVALSGVTDVSVSGTALQETKQTVTVMYESAAGGPGTIDAGTECP